ncbi:3-deoxy-7-phosphoheptulonate synthase [Clostridium cylindrosporum]|uniref:Phospho-2-dehydro-3-deoxyheptonate aldolase AroF n=1 Tax=Clostridium cylindrosporum DSM 605 TaxID=1121307 RepID=A0A0J8DEX7_CLOCY|nr:3-deoxy-7-phosphoheptulonate synthase [Clostridium cylindrosporum]KMT22728.1 phospho-2-dehydro-3-deoxyheptonate aldolase AroF [Clostridium cylindrosporum DSM 605]
MIVVIKPQTTKEEIMKLKEKLESPLCSVQIIEGVSQTILGIVGDTSTIDASVIQQNKCVEKILRVQESYKRANRAFHPEDTVIKVGDAQIGGDKFCIMAGPCSVESESQIVEIAKSVKASGATILRGGAFKPRTSPYAFQGLGMEGLDLLNIAKKETGLPIITEVMTTKYVEAVAENADIIQIGARNMQNFDLLKEVGKTRKPVLLKRGLSATIEELLMSAEYIMSEGNEQVILCERGIRTFENFTRNTLDLSAIPAIKKLSHLPVVVDPSHAAGLNWMVEPLSKAAVAVGADGLIIEVHNDPANALCDGKQSIRPEEFESLVKSLKGIAEINGKRI